MKKPNSFIIASVMFTCNTSVSLHAVVLASVLASVLVSVLESIGLLVNVLGFGSLELGLKICRLSMINL